MRFILSFVLTAVLTVSALYGLILAVDPYNKFGFNLFGFPTKAVDFARENKFNQVEHSTKNYTGFIMGSSSAHRYHTDDLNRITGLTFYNYSTQSATPEDYMAMTRHFLSKYSPKMIIISFDLEVLNKNIKTDDMFFSSPLVKYLDEMPERELVSSLFNNSYFTLEAIADTFQVIWVNLFGKAVHTYLEDGNHIAEPSSKKIEVRQFNFGNFELDETRVSYLKDIVELCNKNNIKLIVFTSPQSIEAINRMDKSAEITRDMQFTKKMLVDIFGSVWDFNDQTIAPYSTTEFFHDSNHPTRKFSGMIIERIFNPEDHPGLGTLFKK